jgi:hypothetical protein
MISNKRFNLIVKSLTTGIFCDHVNPLSTHKVGPLSYKGIVCSVSSFGRAW